MRIGDVPAIITPARAGEANRARVLETLYLRGRQSRAELARALGVTRATITTILQPLLAGGLLVEGDPVASGGAGGKPARPVWFASAGPALGAVHLMPGRIEAARVALDGTLSRRAMVRFDAATADSAAIAAALAEVVDDSLAGGDLLGVGVGVAGMVDTADRRIISMHLAPGLAGFPVGALLADRLDVAVLADHHPRVQALGDRWFGAGRDRDTFASVYTGEALGFGIVYGGVVLRGPRGAGGESGHTTVQADGERCGCGKRGCWETIATTGWLTRQAYRRGITDVPELPDAPGGPLSAGQLAELAASGVGGAAELLDEYARNLAIGMANQEQVLPCSTYIVHGDACTGGEPFRVRLAEHVRELSPTRTDQELEIIFAKRNDVATLLGSAGLVLSDVLSTRA